MVISTNDLRALGAIVDHVLCVIDRSPDQGAALTAEGLQLHALLTRAQLDAAEARRYRRSHVPRRTSVGKRTPGLRMLVGSRACLTARSAARRRGPSGARASRPWPRRCRARR